MPEAVVLPHGRPSTTRPTQYHLMEPACYHYPALDISIVHHIHIEPAEKPSNQLYYSPPAPSSQHQLSNMLIAALANLNPPFQGPVLQPYSPLRHLRKHQSLSRQHLDGALPTWLSIFREARGRTFRVGWLSMDQWRSLRDSYGRALMDSSCRHCGREAWQPLAGFGGSLNLPNLGLAMPFARKLSQSQPRPWRPGLDALVSLL